MSVDEENFISSDRENERDYEQGGYPFGPDVKKVDQLVKHILDAYLWGLVYEPTMCSQRCHDLCKIIKEKTKDLNIDRHKIVVQVILGEDSEESVHMATRTLSNPSTDYLASAVYRNNSLFAIGLVYAIQAEEVPRCEN